MIQDHRCTPARGRYFPLSFAALLGRLAAFPRFRHRNHPPQRLSLHLRNGRLEACHGHLLCVVRPLGYLLVFSLPDHVAHIHGRRAVDYVLDQLRTIIPSGCCGTDPRAFGLHHAYLGPLGRITITRQSAHRRGKGQTLSATLTLDRHHAQNGRLRRSGNPRQHDLAAEPAHHLMRDIGDVSPVFESTSPAQTQARLR